MNRRGAVKYLNALAEHFEDQNLRFIGGYIREAVSALCAPAPDPITGLVPCGFCTDTFHQKPLLQENKYEPYTRMMSTISIEENNGKHQIEIDLWDGGNVYAAFDINYCPMCGRQLDVSETESVGQGPKPGVEVE